MNETLGGIIAILCVVALCIWHKIQQLHKKYGLDKPMEKACNNCYYGMREKHQAGDGFIETCWCNLKKPQIPAGIGLPYCQSWKPRKKRKETK